jgi:hypothetical protein
MFFGREWAGDDRAAVVRRACASSTDATVERRFRRYGRYSGLAFWLYLTRDWVPEQPVP